MRVFYVSIGGRTYRGQTRIRARGDDAARDVCGGVRLDLGLDDLQFDGVRDDGSDGGIDVHRDPGRPAGGREHGVHHGHADERRFDLGRQDHGGRDRFCPEGGVFR